MNRHLVPVALLFLLLGGCGAGSPVFDTHQVDRALTPARAAATPHGAIGKSVLWGGSILEVTNLAYTTRVELQAYPLDREGKPRPDAEPQGRFLLEQDGFLEPLSYTGGRLLTVSGTLRRVETCQVNVSQQPCPVIEARQLHLWPVRRFHEDTGLRFGGEVGYGY
ncbi:MAG TPA: Slp family lipoprotein [Gammaproteobacteria bacterium]|nr:Slp family lipoprotein [Gammaproteobacteria bacterium]